MGWRKTTDLFQQLLINKSGHTCSRQSSTSSITLLAQLWWYRNIWRAHAGSTGKQELFNCRSLFCCRRQQIPSQRGCVRPSRSAGELWNWTQTLFSAVYNSSRKSYLQFQPSGLLTNYSVKVCWAVGPACMNSSVVLCCISPLPNYSQL